MFKFGRSSRRRLNTCEDDLILVAEESLKVSRVDFSITEGTRSPAKQFSYYKKGRRKVGGRWYIYDRSLVVTYKDGLRKKSRHNYKKSKAFDICAYVKGRPDLAYNPDLLIYLSGVITSTAERLYQEKKIKKRVVWGGDFNVNGRMDDENFVDRPHFQI